MSSLVKLVLLCCLKHAVKLHSNSVLLTDSPSEGSPRETDVSQMRIFFIGKATGVTSQHFMFNFPRKQLSVCRQRGGLFGEALLSIGEFREVCVSLGRERWLSTTVNGRKHLSGVTADSVKQIKALLSVNKSKPIVCSGSVKCQRLVVKLKHNGKWKVRCVVCVITCRLPLMCNCPFLNPDHIIIADVNGVWRDWTVCCRVMCFSTTKTSVENRLKLQLVGCVDWLSSLLLFPLAFNAHLMLGITFIYPAMFVWEGALVQAGLITSWQKVNSLFLVQFFLSMIEFNSADRRLSRKRPYRAQPR